MPIQHLFHHQIDKAAWDDCIDQAPNGLVYALSWYLDSCVIDSTLPWAALVQQEAGKYVTVMPIQIKERWGIQHVYQHPMVHELGVFSVYPLTVQEVNAFVEQALSSFRYVAKYRFSVTHPVLTLAKATQTPKITHHLPLNDIYNAVYQRYSTNRKRNLKKSQCCEQQVITGNDIKPLIQMFEQHTLSRISTPIQWEQELLASLYHHAQAQGIAKLYYIVALSGDYIAGGLFLLYRSKIIYLFGSATPQGLANHSMTLLMDTVIREHAETDYVLDFEGGNTTGLSQFYSSFGASPVYFAEMQILRLPNIFLWLNEARRTLQRALYNWFYRSSRSINDKS